MAFWRELRRRHIFRIAAVYAATGWLVLQLGAIVFPALRAPAWALPLLIGFVALGFPVALVLAWAFEVTPEGVRRTKAADEQTGADTIKTRRQVGRVLNAAIIVTLLAAVAVLAWRQTSERGAPARSATVATAAPRATDSAAAPVAPGAPANSIVVLPFLNLSPKGELEYFAEGISEQLLDGLAQATDLKVVARTSALQFKGKPADVREIGKALDVRYVLEGSVRREGAQVRISVQLIDSRTGYHKWSHTYERTLGDVFQVEDDITHAVAATLEAKIAATGAVARANPPTKIGAYDEYLLGQQLLNRRDTDSLRAALTHFKKATELDPNYGPAYAQVAIVYTLLTFGSYGDYSREEALKLARPFLQHAMALAPEAPDTEAARGRYLELAVGPDEALPHFQRAARENPSYMDAVNWEISTLAQVGRYREAWTATQAAVRRDPLNFIVNSNHLYGLLLERRFDEARAVASRFLVLDAAQGHLLLGDIADAEGEPATALRQYLAALAKRPGSRTSVSAVTVALWYAGLDDDAYAFWMTHVGAARGGLIAAHTGHRDAALGQMQAMLQQHRNDATANVIAGEVEMALGRRVQARRYFDRAWQLDDGRTAAFASGFRRSKLITYAALLLQVGMSAKAKTLLDKVRADAMKLEAARVASGIPSDGYEAFRLASVEILAGERDRGLVRLMQAMTRLRASPMIWSDYSLQMPSFLEYAPRFDGVRGDPRFRAILRQSEQVQAQRRAQIVPVLCSWKYAGSDWRPTPATCTGVNAIPAAATAG